MDSGNAEATSSRANRQESSSSPQLPAKGNSKAEMTVTRKAPRYGVDCSVSASTEAHELYL